MLSERSFQDSSLCIVGNINRDVKTAPLAVGSRLLRDGESSTSSITETVGGGGANSAFAAAALGARVTFIGRIGADSVGGRLERALNDHGVTSRVVRDERLPTGTSIALAFENGHRHFISALPSCRALAFKDIDLPSMLSHRHLLRADIWFSENMLRNGNLRLFKAARRAGIDVSLDINWDPHWGSASGEEVKERKEAVRRCLPWVNLVHGNRRELMEFADARSLKGALNRLHQWGAEAVVLHMGTQGAGYFDGNSLVVVPPVKVTRPVNFAGTGDVLSVCMALLHRHAESDPRDRLGLANKIVAQFMEGKRSFIPTLPQ